MRIIHCVASLENKAAGPSYSVPKLAQAQAGLGHVISTHSLGSPGVSSASGNYTERRFAHDYADVPILCRLGFSGTLRSSIIRSGADVIHAHGLWMMHGAYAAAAARKAGRPFILSPRGMLGADALRYSSGSKRAFGLIWQNRVNRTVTCYHATADSEFDDIRSFGLLQPVAVIPNGIEVPALAPSSDATDVQEKRAPYVLSLGRLHPKKGLDRLVASWAQISADFPRWRLRIVGPDENGHASELRRQISSLRLSGSVSIEEAVFGEAKRELMSCADIFALPTLHENFGMTVAESLAVATPVISTVGAPWRGLGEQKAGWWVDHGRDAMAAALRLALALPANERRAMGLNGRAWMIRDFGWQAIASRMLDVYSWQCHGGDAPDWVRL
ncbi:MAG: glycosyltransferase [Mesorhizobium sp.]|uniref:glycosyltransferase n=1 Tax=Mesorhizobium sp. TaxID=1871066 RepID=UPI0011F6F7E3|nr:MAG: glycosyltransferase [Mesorhizobium sp.]